MNQQDSTDLHREIDALAARDWQLWSIAALVIVVFAIGFASMVLPNVMATAALHSDSKYLPQLFFGLIVLIVLFNIYILDQKRELNRARTQVLRQLAECARAQELAIIDPLTNVFNRRYMEEVIPKEQARADRGHHELSFLIIDCDDFKAVNTRFGHFGGDQYLKDFAQLLKSTFRGSDTILRMGGDEFMVILPETSNPQAQRG
jgi:GGDEF domain-containing protein